MSTTITRGVLHIHSAPQALCPHIQWALEALARGRTALDWTAQEAEPGTLRAELTWAGPAGTGALMASALRTLGKIRFEITEEPSPGGDGSRWSFTPDLGVFHATTDAAGNAHSASSPRLSSNCSTQQSQPRPRCNSQTGCERRGERK